jgi:hypothetical protein
MSRCLHTLLLLVVNRRSDVPAGKDFAIQRLQVRGDDPDRAHHIGKGQVSNGLLQTSFNCVASHEPLARR